MATPLIIGSDQEAAFRALKRYAAEHVVDMNKLMPALETEKGKRKHLEKMSQQTLEVPMGFRVTYSVERNHPAGTCRHLSMSAPAKDRVPSPEAVWMVAEYFGFKGGLAACAVWEEELERGDGRQIAINIVQPLMEN